MKIAIKNGIPLLKAEDNYENKVLKSDYLKSKLVYREILKNENSICEKDFFKIKLDYNLFKIDKNLVYYGRVGYVLRVILDTYIVLLGGLPLHAAAIRHKKMTYFLIGNTHSGKSVISNYLKNHYKNIDLIGDDHLVIFNNILFGNDKSRIRKKDGSEYYKENFLGEKKLGKYCICLVNINDSSRFEKIEKNIAINLNFRNTLKYLCENKEIFLENIEMKNILKIYFIRYKHFFYNSIKIIKITNKIMEK